MKRIYGYKTTDDHELWAYYTYKGFVVAESLEEAERHFGIKHNNGYTTVAEVPEIHFENDDMRTARDLDDAERGLKCAINGLRLARRVRREFLSVTEEILND